MPKVEADAGVSEPPTSRMREGEDDLVEEKDTETEVSGKKKGKKENVGFRDRKVSVKSNRIGFPYFSCAINVFITNRQC